MLGVETDDAHRTDGRPAVPREQVPGDVVEAVPLDCVGDPLFADEDSFADPPRGETLFGRFGLADDDAHVAGSVRGLAAESFSFSARSARSAAASPRLSASRISCVSARRRASRDRSTSRATQSSSMLLGRCVDLLLPEPGARDAVGRLARQLANELRRLAVANAGEQRARLCACEEVFGGRR